MSQAVVEHANFTVSNPEAMAEVLCQIFDWNIRWSGDALDDGFTVHVGGDDSYLALYAHPEAREISDRSHKSISILNHIGVVVDDLDAVEEKVKTLGYKPFSHRDYEPGRRFYFLIADDIEIEAISY